MRVAFIGPVGSGKSTQAQRLSWTMPFYNRMPRLSTGDLVRAQIEARTPLGAQIGTCYDAGDPVPDGLILGLLLPHVRTAGGFALDDFPANPGQAGVLDAELEERSAERLHRVISLEAPTDDELVERVLGGRVRSRATDVSCHLENDPPPGPDERLDPGPFVRQDDDTEEALRRRLGAYRREHAPLKGRYEESRACSGPSTPGSRSPRWPRTRSARSGIRRGRVTTRYRRDSPSRRRVACP